MTTAKAEQKINESVDQAARTYLEDIAYDALITRDEPAKTRDIVNAIAMDGVTMRFVKEALGSSNRFEQTDRRWTLASRFIDTDRPMQRIVWQVMESCGRPMTVTELAHELGIIFKRPAEHYEGVLPRLLSTREYYFPSGEDKYGRADWLIVTDSDKEDDVLFDSFLSEEDIAPYLAISEKVNWVEGAPLSGALELLKKTKTPIHCKILQFFAWKSDPFGFEAEEFYSSIVNSDDFLLLYGQIVVYGAMRKDFKTYLSEMAAKIEETPSDGEDDEVEGPVEVTEADLEEIVKLIIGSKGPARAEDILDSVLEVAPGEKAYEGAMESLINVLSNEPRVKWVGCGRWRTPEALPDYIVKVPESLAIPTYFFVTPEGEPLDQELEDEGLESSLRTEINNPLVMDAGDEDTADSKHMQPVGERQRCVLKYRHKEAGTFPLCQINPDFFGAEPAIINVTLLNEGVRRELWLNNTTRLIYDMKDWYGTDMPVSGAVFYIEKTQKPDEFRFVYEGETDDKLFVQPNRLLELLELKDQAESQELPTFEIITEIMERYKQGIEFAQLFTEVNLVRRCARRLVASILSSYHCFKKKESVWRYDAKEKSKGFNKTKRKHIKKV
ncbi:MAG: hypothetical protein Q7N50_06295 [Armatimonadota bacterium]|nr:hypothetical protein [Armatimonadota bacterium]